MKGGPLALPTYSVLLDDNFHYMDEDERYTLGSYPTREEAIDACRQVVDRCLEDQLRPGMTAETLYEFYILFGDDPFVAGEPPSTFSAWDYAQERAAEMTAHRSLPSNTLKHSASPPLAPKA